MSDSDRHDHAWAGAKSVMDVIDSLLMEHEKRDAFAEIYIRLKAMLECYDIVRTRRELRMRPSRN
jgi:hypothetical protein